MGTGEFHPDMEEEFKESAGGRWVIAKFLMGRFYKLYLCKFLEQNGEWFEVLSPKG